MQYYNIKKNGLLTKCEVKMVGQFGQVIFLCVFMDWDGNEVHKLAKKENKASIQLS